MVSTGTVLVLVSAAHSPRHLGLGIATLLAGVLAVLLAVLAMFLAYRTPKRANKARRGKKSKVAKPGSEKPEMRWDWLRGAVHAGAAWSAGDSWATNVSVVGAVLGLITTASTTLAPLIPKASDASVGGLAIFFGGAAAAAPIVYAALAKRPGADGANAGAVGSRLGLFLAGAATLFAILGELGIIAALTFQLPGQAESYAVTAAVVLAAGAVSAYSVRSLHFMAVAEHSDSKGSFLSKPGKTSATL
jgi:hypothetical protein